MNDSNFSSIAIDISNSVDYDSPNLQHPLGNRFIEVADEVENMIQFMDGVRHGFYSTGNWEGIFDLLKKIEESRQLLRNLEDDILINEGIIKESDLS